MPFLRGRLFYLWNQEEGEKIPGKKKFVEKSAGWPRRMPRSKSLLTHHDAESAPPAFREAHANDFQLGREILQEFAGRGMKSQRGRNQVDERRNLLQFDAG